MGCATAGPVSTLAAKAATATVPIAFAVGNDPVQLGLAASLSRPGGNLTGSSSWGREDSAKGLEVLHELLPTTVSIGFLANPKSKTISELQTIDVLAAGRNLGVEIQILHASAEDELNAAFAKLAQARTGALLISVDYFFNSWTTKLVAEWRKRQKTASTCCSKYRPRPLEINAQCALAQSRARRLVSHMPDSLRKRLSELDQLAYQSGDRFAGADEGAGAHADRLMVRLQALEAEAQNTLVSVSTQIAKLEGTLDELRRVRDQLLLRVT